MRALHRAFDFLGQHATLFLAGGVLLGLLVPPLAALARPMLIPGLLIPLVIALVRLDWDALAAYARAGLSTREFQSRYNPRSPSQAVADMGGSATFYDCPVEIERVGA